MEEQEVQVEEQVEEQQEPVVEGEEQAPEALAQPEGTDGDPPAEPVEAEAYSPDFSYKVYGEEKTLPEEIQALIKNKETEDYFRDVFSQRDAVPILKEKQEAARKQYEDLNTLVNDKYEPILKELQAAGKAVQNGDMDKFFEALGVDSNKALQWAVDKARYREMSAEEKQAYDDRISMRS